MIAKVKRRVECCKSLEAAAAAFGLCECWKWKPLLDGRQVDMEFLWFLLFSVDLRWCYQGTLPVPDII
jgi:hypothetical protein